MGNRRGERGGEKEEEEEERKQLHKFNQHHLGALIRAEIALQPLIKSGEESFLEHTIRGSTRRDESFLLVQFSLRSLEN